MFNKNLINAFRNTKIVNFAFGEKVRCTVCDKVITDPEEIKFEKFEGVCFACEHVLGNVEDMLAEHAENYFNNQERIEND